VQVGFAVYATQVRQKVHDPHGTRLLVTTPEGFFLDPERPSVQDFGRLLLIQLVAMGVYTEAEIAAWKVGEVQTVPERYKGWCVFGCRRA
jgi:hypothetical protein